MTATRISHVAVSVGDEVAAHDIYRWTDSGADHAVLRVGPALTLYVAHASPQVLRRIAELAAELADWREKQITQGET